VKRQRRLARPHLGLDAVAACHQPINARNVNRRIEPQGFDRFPEARIFGFEMAKRSRIALISSLIAVSCFSPEPS
jgi:hypothetical protein